MKVRVSPAALARLANKFRARLGEPAPSAREAGPNIPSADEVWRPRRRRVGPASTA